MQEIFVCKDDLHVMSMSSEFLHEGSSLFKPFCCCAHRLLPPCLAAVSTSNLLLVGLTCLLD